MATTNKAAARKITSGLFQAHKEFPDAMRPAMLKTGPSIQAVLNKIPHPNRRDG